MNQDLIVVSTKDKIFIYKLNGLEIVDRLEVENHLGRIVLSPCAELNPYVAYSQSLKDGQLTVYDYRQQRKLKSIDCHKTPILKLAFSPFGNMIATCSTQGGMIRVFAIPTGEKLYTLSRGATA